jgi:uncharacterized OB-fold protein
MGQNAAEYGKPLPETAGLAGEFYGFCKRGELRFQRCGSCRAWRHVPREMCAECGSWDWSWEASSGRGSVFSWTVVARALHPSFQDDTPYACVVVELEEGVRLLSHVAGVAPDGLRIDMPVEVFFEAVTDEVTLPKFRPAGA